MRKYRVVYLSLIVILYAGFRPLMAGEEKAPSPMTPAEVVAAIHAVENSLVRVEYTLRFDKGEKPECPGWGVRCSNCGNFHGVNGEEFVKEERPLESAGFLLSSNQVLTSDTMIHPRFVEKIQVRFGTAVTTATIESIATDQCAVILRLESPLDGAHALVFVTASENALLVLNYARHNGVWKTSAEPLSMKIRISEGEAAVSEAPSFCLITDRKGRAVAVSMKDEIPLDESWKGSPLAWSLLPAVELQAQLNCLEEVAAKGILRVTLNFRSPKQEPGNDRRQRRPRISYGGEEEDAAQRHALALLMDNRSLLILEQLTPATMARLERIQVHLSAEEVVSASFRGSLKDFGAFVAELERPLPFAIPRATVDLRSLNNRLLLAAEIRIAGSERIATLQHRRIAGFEAGRWGKLYPKLPGDNKHLFLFTLDGQLTVLPVRMRESIALQERWSSNRNASPVPVALLASVSGDLKANSDPNNVPLTEEMENRLAWLGVELQGLTFDLARANNVAALTRNGEFGAIVSYVYPDSPAHKAGIEPGAILLRLHVEGEPKPFDVCMEEDGFNGEAFPWEQLDEVPPEYFDEIPTPWESAENPFIRSLTDFGIGKAYRAEFFIDENVVFKDFVIAQSPPHFAMAAKFKSEILGLTVREITYELRRYFQLTSDTPGVIIARIEQGSRAAVAGIKPYEIITQINEQDVKTPADVERLTKNTKEWRLNIKRMTKTRVVKLQAEAGTPEAPEAGE